MASIVPCWFGCPICPEFMAGLNSGVLGLGTRLVSLDAGTTNVGVRVDIGFAYNSGKAAGIWPGAAEGI